MKKTFDLGFQPYWWPGKDDYEEKEEKDDKKDPPTYHPSFSVSDPKLAAALMNMRDGTATIKFHVSSINIRDGDSRKGGMYCGSDSADTGCNVEIEVISMTVDAPADTGKGEDSASEALENFLKSKSEDSDDSDEK